MATSKLTIFNAAADVLGEPNLRNVDEETELARKLRSAWEPTRDSCLEEAPWNFLETRATLARLDETPEWGYQYYYGLPGDLVRILRVNDTGIERDELLTWREESGKLATDAEAVYLRYTSNKNKDKIGMWSQAFCDRLAAELAVKAAPKINPSMAETAMKLAERRRRKARQIDASQSPPLKIRPGTVTSAPKRWRNVENDR